MLVVEHKRNAQGEDTDFERHLAERHLARAVPHLRRALQHYEKAGAPRSLLLTLRVMAGNENRKEG